MATAISDLTLANLRDETRRLTPSGKPMTAEAVGRAVAEVLGRPKPYTFSSVLKWESSHPPRDIRIIEALAVVYGQPFDVVKDACCR